MSAIGSVSTSLSDSLLRPIPWLMSFAIDEDMIDREHQHLISLINEICALAARHGAEAQERLMREDAAGLLDSHFAHEERILDDIGFSDLLSHQREHDHIRTLIAPLYSQQHDLGLARALLSARTGLVEHIIRHDLGFKSHLLDRDGR